MVKHECSVNMEHVAACTNKSPGCVSCGSNLVAFGASNSVIVCNTKFKGNNTKYKHVVGTLNKHTERVNCVSWILNYDHKVSSPFLLSGSTDKSVIIWKCALEKGENYIFEAITSIKGCSAAVTNVDGIIYEQNAKAVFASTSVDMTVCIWKSTSLEDFRDIHLLQKIDFQPSLILTISLHLLPDQTPILACGLDNFKISLHCMNNDEDNFHNLLTLPGHEDWVRGTDFVTLDNGDLLLATCSQDSFIRLWKISKKPEVDEQSDILKLREIEFKTFNKNSEERYVVHLEAVLSGHEGWVYSVHWNKNSISGNIRLLSASMDKSIIIWEVDEDSGIWMEKVRFGEVGGNTLGFYGAQFNTTGSEVIAHSYNGALHLWDETDGDWMTGIVVSGHFGPVLDMSWEPKYGRYLVSTSTDQTTRLFAEWNFGDEKSWHEIARPQIHGYDMQCISMIDSCRYISGADEKVLRVFEAPQNFYENLKRLSGSEVTTSRKLPEGATIPALGLSNKAVFSSEQIREETPTSRGEQYIENQFRMLTLQKPPSEEHLLQNSLWPETNKLYCHVYEIFCVAANSCGTLVASAAKSSTPQHSVIVLWNTKSWKEVAKLLGHTLTVTQMEFSHSGKFLLSVSRDRTWILHQILYDDRSGYSAAMFAKSNKTTCHARIIWSTSWTHDDRFFCTGSRDKKIIFWTVNEGGENRGTDTSGTELITRMHAHSTCEAVTAVAFALKSIKSSQYLLAIGKESGCIEIGLLLAATEKYDFKILYKFSANESHSATVKRLSWRPSLESHDNKYWIATSASDNLIKLFSIELR